MSRLPASLSPAASISILLAAFCASASASPSASPSPSSTPVPPTLAQRVAREFQEFHWRARQKRWEFEDQQLSRRRAFEDSRRQAQREFERQTEQELERAPDPQALESDIAKRQRAFTDDWEKKAEAERKRNDEAEEAFREQMAREQKDFNAGIDTQNR